MRYFVIVYDRPAGTLVQISEFESDRRQEALAKRFELERRFGDPQYEVVVLGGTGLAQIKRTHGRYFKNLRELATN